MRIGLVVAFAAGILGLGILGPRSGAGPGSTPPAGSNLAALNAAGSSDGTGPVEGLPGVAPFRPTPADLRTSQLPSDISGQALAAVGTRLFFVTSAGLQSTVIGSGAAPATLVSLAPCHSIDQVVASGNVLGYVETAPASSSPWSEGCDMPTRMAWTIWFSDLDGGHKRLVASGERAVDTAVTRRYPVRLALTPRVYAFNRPNSPGLMATGETLEVHSVAGDKLLWTVQSDSTVAGLMLGGATLAVLESEPWLEISVSDALNPVLTHFALPASSASLSSDGQYLTWDTAPDATHDEWQIVTTQLKTGGTRAQAVPSDAPAPTPLRPVVASTAAGPLVAWYATAANGAVYPEFVDPSLGRGGVYPGMKAPRWLALSGSTLVMVGADARTGGNVAVALDLSRSGFAPQ